MGVCCESCWLLVVYNEQQPTTKYIFRALRATVSTMALAYALMAVHSLQSLKFWIEIEEGGVSFSFFLFVADKHRHKTAVSFDRYSWLLALGISITIIKAIN
jgi:hypothetical protein